MEIGPVVRAERKRQRLTQTDLGRQVGVSRQAIAALEREGGRVSTLCALQPLLRLHAGGLARGKTILDQVRATRVRRGLSLRDVASATELAVNTVRDVERGGGSISSLMRICDFLSKGAVLKAGASHNSRHGFVTVTARQPRDGNPADYYATPAPVTRLLLDHESFDAAHPILEPAVGEARAIDRVLRERGFETVCFDLHGCGCERQDFLSLEGTYESLITNPPFSRHVEFVLKAKQVVRRKFAMLLPMNYLTGAQRLAEMWEDKAFPLARVHVLNRGVNFAHAPHVEKFRTSQLYVAWFVFERGHAGPPIINWIDCAPWIEKKSRLVKV